MVWNWKDYVYAGYPGLLGDAILPPLKPWISKIVRLRRGEFLEAVEKAKPEVIHRIKDIHFFCYDMFVVVTFECKDGDFKQRIEVIKEEWNKTEPDIIPVRKDAKHHLDGVGAIDFLNKLAEDLEKDVARRRPHIRKVGVEEVGVLDRCPKCRSEWKEESEECPACGFSLYDYIDIKQKVIWCLTCLRRIYRSGIRLRRSTDGKVLLLCPYCDKNLMMQSIKTAIFHWIKYPIIVLMVFFLLWLLGWIKGDILFR